MSTLTTVNYDLRPHIKVPGDHFCDRGWDAIADRLKREFDSGNRVVVLDCYTGVLTDDVREKLGQRLGYTVINSESAMRSKEEILKLVEPFNGGDDPIFGLMNNLQLSQFFDNQQVAEIRRQIENSQERVLLCGIGAALITHGDCLILADMARWEGQLRQRRNEVSNLGLDNFTEKASLQYKRAFFTDWRVCDRHKKPLIKLCDYLLDTCIHNEPKLISGEAFRAGLESASRQPFRVVPFFDPAPWGGQWMREHCGLDGDAPNYGWCFDGVPEENSLLLRIAGIDVEVPSLDLVFEHPVSLLGDQVHARFGMEFPIRFDFLDTIKGGHLSFQIHPLTEYIQEHFGMHYTQDESYYMLDAVDGATVFLGLKDNADIGAMEDDLRAAQRGEIEFPAELYANEWSAKKHDHFLIPAGTVHCSGKGSMVLEISATPYIFTFKLWDWGRLGLDGKPRPINIERGMANIQFDRTTEWTQQYLINTFEEIDSGEGWRAERTGLHKREFIDTVRHWFTCKVLHKRGDSVDVLNLVEGREAIVESPEEIFEPFVVHYAETFIVPFSAGPYTIRPHGEGSNTECVTMRARVRV